VRFNPICSAICRALAKFSYKCHLQRRTRFDPLVLVICFAARLDRTKELANIYSNCHKSQKKNLSARWRPFAVEPLELLAGSSDGYDLALFIQTFHLMSKVGIVSFLKFQLLVGSVVRHRDLSKRPQDCFHESKGKDSKRRRPAEEAES